jgi:hypothetical protein
MMFSLDLHLLELGWGNISVIDINQSI